MGRDTGFSPFNTVIHGLCAHNTHALYHSRRPGATAAKPGCVSQFKKERRKKDKKLLGQGAKSASVKSSISLKQHARNLL